MDLAAGVPMKNSEMSNRYHVLSRTLPEHHVENMLGRVVVDKRDPLHCFIPYSDEADSINPIDIVPDISDKPVQYDDLSQVLGAAQDNDAKLRLHQILDAHARKASSRNVQVTSAVVVRYDMINVERKLSQLMRDRNYRSQAVSLLSKNEGRPLPMVTGVMTCKDTVVKLATKAESEIGVGMRAPIGEATGGSSLGDPEAKFKHQRNDTKAAESKIKDEVIFALAYDEVKLEAYMKRKCWLPKFSKPQTKSNKVSLGAKIPGDGIDLYFGDNDEIEEDTDDDDEKRLVGKGPSGSLQFTIC